MSSGTMCLRCRAYEAKCECAKPILSDNARTPNNPCDHYPHHCEVCDLCWCGPKIEKTRGGDIIIHNEVQ